VTIACLQSGNEHELDGQEENEKLVGGNIRRWGGHQQHVTPGMKFAPG
jgi:hypothetical protein